jgi:flagellar basal-body rod modification protein FlgD
MSSIPGVNTGNSAASAQNGFAALTSEDFVRIMTSELANQDPLAPNDSKAILEQISSIRAIESNLTLKKSLETLVRQSEFATAGGLIGSEVIGLDAQGATVRGLVKSVANTSDGATLNLELGQSVRMKDLVQIVSRNDSASTDGASAASGLPSAFAPGAV